MMRIYQIDDGAVHTVAAESDADAFAIYMKYLILGGLDWPEEKPSIEVVAPEKTVTIYPFDDTRALAFRAADWVHFFDGPQYLGCSER